MTPESLLALIHLYVLSCHIGQTWQQKSCNFDCRAPINNAETKYIKEHKDLFPKGYVEAAWPGEMVPRPPEPSIEARVLRAKCFVKEQECELAHTLDEKKCADATTEIVRLANNPKVGVQHFRHPISGGLPKEGE